MGNYLLFWHISSVHTEISIWHFQCLDKKKMRLDLKGPNHFNTVPTIICLLILLFVDAAVFTANYILAVLTMQRRKHMTKTPKCCLHGIVKGLVFFKGMHISISFCLQCLKLRSFNAEKVWSLIHLVKP